MRFFRFISGSFSKEKTLGRSKCLFATRRVKKVFGSTQRDRFIYEIPVSVVPFFRTPIHSTFLYLFGRRYFKRALSLLDARSSEIVYLFHGVDGLDLQRDGVVERNVVPLRRTFEARVELIELILRSLNGLKRPKVTMEELISRL